MAKFSIAEEQKSINEVLQDSKLRLSEVNKKIALLERQQQSIMQDIEILSTRKVYTSQTLQRKQKAYTEINSFVNQAQESYNKLVSSTKTLLTAFKKQQQKVNDIINQIQSN